MAMKRMFKKTKIYVVAVIALAFVFTLVMFFPAAGAETEDESIEIKSSEAWILDTDTIGNIEKARMITWFDIKGEGTVDVTKENTLEDTKWQGVHGFTAPVVEDDHLVWKNVKVDGNANVLSSAQVEGEDLVEEVSMRIPLELHYEYWFDEEGDGKDIMAKVVNLGDIVGKNGHFRMELTMTNTSDEMTEVEYQDPDTGETITGEVETYLPLVILPYDWYFPNDVFFDLKVDPTGLVVHVPSYYQLGWSIPLFPPATERSHTIWVEADVKNFEMPPLVLSANFVFPETNQVDPMPLFVSGFEQLYDGIKQVNEGIGVTDIESEETLLYGITAMKDGLEQMAAGLPEAMENINNQMIPGVAEAAEGIGSPGTPDTLMYAIDQSALGLMEMVAGIGGPNVDGSALFGLSAMQAGLEEMATGIGSVDTPDTLLFAGDQVSMGLEAIKAGIGDAAVEDTLLYAMSGMREGLLEMKDGIGSPTTDPSLLYGVAQVQWGLEQMKAGIGTTTTDPSLLFGIDQAQQGLNELLAGVHQITMGVSSGSSADPGLLEGLQELRDGLVELNAQTAPYTTEMWQALGLIRVLAPWTGPIVDGLEQGICLGDEDNPSIHIATGLMVDGLDEMIAGIGAVGVDGTLLDGLDRLAKGIDDPTPGTQDLMYALGEISKGLSNPGDPNNPGLLQAIGSTGEPMSLMGGMAQIAEGLDEMLKGISNPSGEPDLLFAVNQVELGLIEMKKGIGSEENQESLIYAMSAISGGLNDIKEGIGSAATADTLLFAVTQVADGLELMKAGIGAEGASDTLLYAMAQVQHGLALMQAGLSTGDMNNPGLKEGLILVSSGLGDAVEGLGSETTEDTLIYAADQVKGGLDQLAEGTLMMEQGLMDNLGMMYLSEAQLEAIKVRGEEFDHIMGRADDAENVVTFIYQTPPTYGYKDGSSWLTAAIISLLLFLALVLGGILLARRPMAG